MVWDITPVPDDAAYASNWWRILLVDAAIGVGIAALGVFLGLTWTPLAWALLLLGGYYEYLVVRRFFRWRSLRGLRRPDPG
jgi:hypothetical protein